MKKHSAMKLWGFIGPESTRESQKIPKSSQKYLKRTKKYLKGPVVGQ